MKTRCLTLGLVLCALVALSGCLGVETQLPPPPSARSQPTPPPSVTAAPASAEAIQPTVPSGPTPAVAAAVAATSAAVPSPTAVAPARTAATTARTAVTPTTRPPGEPTASAPHPGPTAPAAADAWQLRTPLIVDDANGRLYGLAQAAPASGYPGPYRIEVFAARDAQRLATFPDGGPFALDASGGRLFVDLGNAGVAVRDATDGRLLRMLPVPGELHPYQVPPDPQYDPETGQVLVFRGPSVYGIDPKSGEVVRKIDFDLRAQDNCSQPHDAPVPVNRSFYDPARRLLYVDFVTYACIPWIGYTNVSYDLAAGREIARAGSDPYSATTAPGRFYAFGWYRMGSGTFWARRDGLPDTRTTGWSNGSAFQVDGRRSRLYQGAEGAIRIFDSKDMTLVAAVPQPVEGELAAYDPATDQLYFVKDDTVRAWPAEKLDQPAGQLAAAATLPGDAVRLLAPSPNWPVDRTLLGVWAPPWPETSCYVFNQSGGPLFMTHDGGTAWQGPTAGLAAGCGLVSALVVSPDFAHDRTLLAGLKGNGVFRSTDGGASWEPASAGLPHMGVRALAISPGFASDRTAFAAVQETGVLRSTDGGRSWQPLNSAIPWQVALSPEFDRDGTLAVAGRQEARQILQLSTDRGDHWSTAPVPLPGDGTAQLLSLAPAFARWHVLFFVDGAGDLYRSGDGGGSWQRVLQAGEEVPGQMLERAQIAYGPDEAQRKVFLLVSGTNQEGENRRPWGSLFQSSDGGQTWSPVPLAPGTVPTALAISPAFPQDHTLLIGTAEGKVLTVQPLP